MNKKIISLVVEMFLVSALMFVSAEKTRSARKSIPSKESINVLFSSGKNYTVNISHDLQNEEDVKVILYTYFDRNKKSNFFTSNELIKSAYKYTKLTKEDFLEVSKK